MVAAALFPQTARILGADNQTVEVVHGMGAV